MINDFLNIMIPQLCLGFFIILQLVLGMFLSPRMTKYARFVSITGIALSAVSLTFVQIEPQYFGLKNAVMSDYYTTLLDFVILICGFFIALLTKNLVEKSKQNAYTLHALLLTALFGALNIVGANDFLTLFISIELLSFPTYFLIASNKGYYSKEACFKYLITSAVSTGVFLFGVSYLYGLTSSVNFTEINEFMNETEPSLLYLFASIMIIMGLVSKLSIFPFANWVIDVYKGCETSVLAYLSTIPKLAVFGIVCRLLVFPLSYSYELAFIIAGISIITVLWANIYAIREKNVKAIFACSSAANASYMLLVASIVTVYNLSTVIFYLICYVIMNLTVFTFLNIAEYNNIGMEFDDFKSLFDKNRNSVLAYAIAVIGLAGLPVTSGFVAKIYLFSAIVKSGPKFLPFLFILLLLMVVALYYYLKLIFPLFKKDDTSIIPLEVTYSQKFILFITVALTLIIGIYPEKLIELCCFIAYNI